jgi:hypothetical protein
MNIANTHFKFIFAGFFLSVLVNTAPNPTTISFPTENDDSVQNSTYLSPTKEQTDSDTLFYKNSVTIDNTNSVSTFTTATTINESLRGAARVQQARVDNYSPSDYTGVPSQMI